MPYERAPRRCAPSGCWHGGGTVGGGTGGGDAVGGDAVGGTPVSDGLAKVVFVDSGISFGTQNWSAILLGARRGPTDRFWS